MYILSLIWKVGIRPCANPLVNKNVNRKLLDSNFTKKKSDFVILFIRILAISK